MLSPVRVIAPNINAMYNELFYAYSTYLNDRSLAPSSPGDCCVAPFAICPPWGVHIHTWGGTWTVLVVSHEVGTQLAKPQVHAITVLSSSNSTFPSLG